MKHFLVSVVILFSCRLSEAAYISAWRGEVDLKKAGTESWERVAGTDKVMLASGDELRTARASTVEIFTDDGSKIKLAPLSAFKVSAENTETVSLGLYFGRVRSWVKKFSKKFEVRTPSAVCAVRGTDFTVSADEEGGTRVEVYEGSVLAGDGSGTTGLVTEGQFVEIPKDGKMKVPHENPNPPGSMDAASGDSRELAKREIYDEISKEDVLASAQAEIQSAEYQNRKVAIDALGNRVRMEEYIVRPAADQFKYVVLNTRAARFDFGKILFTFTTLDGLGNRVPAELPADLSLATKNMISATGADRPQWELAEINSIMSNAYDKVTENATGGKMVPDNASAPAAWTHFFSNYGVYAQGGDQPSENDGMGKMLWTFTDSNADNTVQAGELSYLGGSAPAGGVTFPSGEDVFHTVTRNTYSDADGTWISAEDFVLFDSGKILSSGDLASTLGSNMDKVTNKLNFERIYTSSLFGNRKIDLEYSAKLLKDAGLLRF